LNDELEMDFDSEVPPEPVNQADVQPDPNNNNNNNRNNANQQPTRASTKKTSDSKNLQGYYRTILKRNTKSKRSSPKNKKLLVYLNKKRNSSNGMSTSAFSRMLIKSPLAKKRMIKLLDDPWAFMKSLMTSNITRKEVVLQFLPRFRWGA
jgi:hypothetical protein